MRQQGFAPFHPRLWGVSDTPHALQRAHELMSIGDYAAAALNFEQLASAAETHQGPRAPFLYLQAGRARIMQGYVAVGMPHLKRGLLLLAESGRYNQLYRAGQRIIQELKFRGMDKESRDISIIVGSNIPALADMPTERGPDMASVILPSHCSTCGGPIRSSEVEWVDKTTAECPFCGSPVRAE
jgi:hypothetical protein